MSTTVLLIHGAWHGPWVWNSVLAELTDLDVHTVQLDSSGNDPARLGDLYDDAKTVRSALASLAGPVTVVAHSYGGMVASEAVSDASVVERLIYLCAFQLDVGESMASALGGEFPPPWCDVAENHVRVSDPFEVFYNDVPDDLARSSAARVGLQSLRSFEQPLRNAAWRTIPSTYIVCEKDRAIPPEAQRGMARRASAVRTLDTGHSPFLSAPSDLVSQLRTDLGVTPRKPT